MIDWLIGNGEPQSWSTISRSILNKFNGNYPCHATVRWPSSTWVVSMQDESELENPRNTQAIIGVLLFLLTSWPSLFICFFFPSLSSARSQSCVDNKPACYWIWDRWKNKSDVDLKILISGMRISRKKMSDMRRQNDLFNIYHQCIKYRNKLTRQNLKPYTRNRNKNYLWTI